MTPFTNKFGMFIHWGFYAQLGLQEQVYARYDMTKDAYEPYQHTFNPVDYDPEKWVLLAKEAGMEYICFTAKHHDGFCMWDTKYTDYSITHTPYGKDVLKMLADACKKHGLRLSVYYSCPDWHYEYGRNPNATHQWKAGDKVDTVKLREFIKNQITELCTDYGPLYTFFWDIPPHIDDPSINELVRRLQPGIFINDRGFDGGDFSTPEREYNAVGAQKWFDRMTEACNSVGEQSWGYRREEDFYSLRHLMYSIDQIMAMGGSYLLNVGPDGKGVIREEYADRIRAIGDWYNRMNGCFVGAEPDTFDYRIHKNEYIATKKDGKTYFHFHHGIMSTAVNMQAWPRIPRTVRLMNTGEVLPWRIELLPECFNGELGKADGDRLHIFNIPVDALSNEPIVLEVTWEG